METEIEKQEGFYNKYWRAMEEDFKQNETLFNKFVRIISRSKQEKSPISMKFMKLSRITRQKEGIGMENLLKDLQKYCGYFCRSYSKRSRIQKRRR